MASLLRVPVIQGAHLLTGLASIRVDQRLCCWRCRALNPELSGYSVYESATDVRYKDGIISSRFCTFESVSRRYQTKNFQVVSAASAADAGGHDISASEGLDLTWANSYLISLLIHVSYPFCSCSDCRIVKPSKSFAERFPALITGGFFFMWCVKH